MPRFRHKDSGAETVRKARRFRKCQRVATAIRMIYSRRAQPDEGSALPLWYPRDRREPLQEGRTAVRIREKREQDSRSPKRLLPRPTAVFEVCFYSAAARGVLVPDVLQRERLGNFFVEIFQGFLPAHHRRHGFIDGFVFSLHRL